jgi:hypothetical protein
VPTNPSTTKTTTTPAPAKKRGRPAGVKNQTPRPKIDDSPSIKIANELEEEGKKLLAAAAVLRERNAGKATK